MSVWFEHQTQNTGFSRQPAQSLKPISCIQHTSNISPAQSRLSSCFIAASLTQNTELQNKKGFSAKNIPLHHHFRCMEMCVCMCVCVCACV